jgi:LPXTG-motif cell wall-anchored protein
LALGDLNGDGHTDFAVPVATGPSTADDVIVAQALSPGTYDVFEFGITLPQGSFAAMGVADQDADGFDDVGIGTVSSNQVNTVASGRDLIAPGPASSLSSIPPSIVAMQGTLAAVITLRVSGPPALVELLGAPLDEGSIALVAHDAGRTIDLEVTQRLVSTDSGFGINQLVNGFLDTAGHHIVRIESSSRNQGSSTFEWDLDPCLVPADSGTPPTDNAATVTNDELPRTGSHTNRDLSLAALSILVGIGLVVTSSVRQR